MHIKRWIAVALTSGLAASLACSLPLSPSANTGDEVATSVAATLTAVAPSPTRIAHSPPATATATPEPEPATISGRICFPSESIPPMDLYIEDLDHATAVEMRIARDQSSYSVDVPAGHYLAYAWLPDFSLYGGYTHAVPCGLSVECTDHRLVELSLDAGEKRADVDICDWYAPQSDWHHPPS